MKRFGVLAALCVCVGISNGSAAPRKPAKAAPKVKLTAAQVLEKATQAAGGLAAYARIKNVLTDGIVEVYPGGSRGTFEHRVKAPGRSLNITRFGTAEASRHCYNGKEAWGYSPVQGYRTITGPEKAFMAHNARLQQVMDWREVYSKLEMVGLRKVGTRPAYAVRAYLPGHAPLVCYFDAKTFLMTRFDTVTAIDQLKNLPMQMYFGDFRKVDGIQWPFQSTTKVGKSLITVMQVNNLLTNVAMADELFVRPQSPVTAAR